MSIEIKVPQLPESVEEATVGEWHVSAGDQVGRDDNVVDLETDKVMLEVPVTSAGVIKEILKEEGETVGEGDVLAVLSEGEASEGGGESAPSAESDTAAEEGPSEPEETEPETAGEEEPETGAGAESGGQSPALSPAVRKLVAEYDIDPNRITGTGKDGRIVKADVQQYLEQQEKSSSQPAESKQKKSAPQPQKPQEGSLAQAQPGERVEQRVPMTRIRARIAERLVEAQQTAAMLTTFNGVDLQAVNDVRKRYRDDFEKHFDVRLGFMSFFVKASVEALKRYPVVNASIDGKDIVYHSYFDIGIAVSSPRGLVVPILRDADQKSFAEVEQQIVDFGRKSQDNKLTMDDLTGGTFSITNGGVFGSMLSTPILNPPQSAILGMHAIQERPMVVDGEIQVRPMMYLALSYDHRIVDGREAVLFLRVIKETLEDPARLLLQI
jgi:2-oxoglutarate dehydrogenase E2 component (dihydrolipoamide succinyltransferase)